MHVTPHKLPKAILLSRAPKRDYLGVQANWDSPPKTPDKPPHKLNIYLIYGEFIMKIRVE